MRNIKGKFVFSSMYSSGEEGSTGGICEISFDVNVKDCPMLNTEPSWDDLLNGGTKDIACFSIDVEGTDVRTMDHFETIFGPCKHCKGIRIIDNKHYSECNYQG